MPEAGHRTPERIGQIIFLFEKTNCILQLQSIIIIINPTNLVCYGINENQDALISVERWSVQAIKGYVSDLSYFGLFLCQLNPFP